MNKIISIISAVLCCCAVKAVELNCTFDKKLPAGVKVNGTLEQENGTSVMVNNKSYVAAIIPFIGEADSEGILEIELATVGEPLSKLGGFLYRRENGKLVTVKNFVWLKNVPRDDFGKMTFKFAPGSFQQGTEYQIYLFRANQKGTLKIRSINFKTGKVGKSIQMNYNNNIF